jgi:hypothetical protein
MEYAKIQNTPDVTNEPPKFPIGSIDFSDQDSILEELRKEPEPTPAAIKLTVGADELLSRQVKALPMLLDPLLPKTGVGCIAGSSDGGKSSFLRQLGFQTAAGEQEFLGFPLYAKHRRVIYVSTEDDSMAISYLLNLQNRGKHYTPDQLAGLQYLFETENLLQNLEASLTAAPADLVVIDCFSDAFGGKGTMNESNHVRGFLNPFKELADKHQCLVMFLHHTGKRTEQLEPSKQNLLGSQGIEAKMRIVLELRQDPHDPTIRHLCIVKGNYLPHGYKDESFALLFDENMLFSNTGHRTPFEHLVKIKVERSPEQREQLIEQVKELSVQGKSQREISKQLNISLGSVNGYLKNGSSVHVQSNP